METESASNKGRRSVEAGDEEGSGDILEEIRNIQRSGATRMSRGEERIQERIRVAQERAAGRGMDPLEEEELKARMGATAPQRPVPLSLVVDVGEELRKKHERRAHLEEELAQVKVTITALTHLVNVYGGVR